MVASPIRLVLTCAFLATTLSVTQADSITLKNGEEYEGVIQRETDTQVVMTVQVSENISDEMTFEKSEVRAVVKTPRDKLAFANLKALKAGPNSLAPAAYDAAIASFESFQKKFPDSAHSQEVKNEIEILKEEKARVLKKELKWNNRWYTAAEAVANRYQINAQRLLAQAREAASRGDFVGTLNACDRLEQVYPGSEVYPDSVRFAISIIPRLDKEIDRMTVVVKRQEQEFNEGIVLAVEPEKSRMIAAQAGAITRADAAVEQSSAKWKPFLPVSQKSTTALKATVTSELSRLSAIQLAPIEKSIAAAREALKELAARNAAQAELKIKEAQTLWANNEALQRLTPALEALKVELAAAAAPVEAAPATPVKEEAQAKTQAASATAPAAPAAK